MLSGLRTRSASASFVFALVAQNAPGLIVTSTNAIKNAETFLNILPPQKPAKRFASSLFSMTVWVVFRMPVAARRLAKERRKSLSLVGAFSRRDKNDPLNHTKPNEHWSP